MKGFKNKPAVLPAAEPSAAKFGEDEAAPETRFEGGGEAVGMVRGYLYVLNI